MAKPDHLEIVRGGAGAIAEWRKQQKPGERAGLDLSGATLERAQLRMADLEFADMSGAAASNADFSRGILRHANCDHLVNELATAVIAPAEDKAKQLVARRALAMG